MTVDEAFNILQSALDRCRFGDTRTRDVDEALIFLEERSALKCLSIISLRAELTPLLIRGQGGSLASSPCRPQRHPPERRPASVITVPFSAPSYPVCNPHDNRDDGENRVEDRAVLT